MYAKIRITQFLFCCSYMHVYFLLTRTQVMLHKTNLDVFISFLDMHVFYQSSLLPAYGWIKKGGNKKELWVTLSSPSLQCHHIQHKLLADTGK